MINTQPNKLAQLMTCPHCLKGHEPKEIELEYTQSAIIHYKLVAQKLEPDLSDISFGEDTYLFCPECGLDSENDGELYQALQKLDDGKY